MTETTKGDTHRRRYDRLLRKMQRLKLLEAGKADSAIRTLMESAEFCKAETLLDQALEDALGKNAIFMLDERLR